MEYKAIFDDGFKNACKPGDVDVEKLKVYTHDHSGKIMRGGKLHRFGYLGEGDRVRPLLIALEHPAFSGNEPHPIPHDPHHGRIPLFGSALQCNADLEGAMLDMARRICQKLNIKEPSNHIYVTKDCRVYSVKCETFWDQCATLDHLTCLKVNGVLVIPDLHEDKYGEVTCHFKIVMACVA